MKKQRRCFECQKLVSDETEITSFIMIESKKETFGGYYCESCAKLLDIEFLSGIGTKVGIDFIMIVHQTRAN